MIAPSARLGDEDRLAHLTDGGDIVGPISTVGSPPITWRGEFMSIWGQA